MSAVHTRLRVSTRRRGLHEITGRVEEAIRESGISDGVAHVFVRHTSASLVLMENADPSARRDLEEWFDRMVPDGTGWFTHTLEGSDDMPAHIRSVLTGSSETIPFVGGRLLLGTWQGIFVFEHRVDPKGREVVVTVVG